MFNTFYLYLSLQDFLQGTYRSLYAMEQFKELTERKSLHIVEKHATAKVGFTVQNIQNGRTGEEHMKLRMGVVDLLQFCRPSFVLVYLVDIKPFKGKIRFWEFSFGIWRKMGNFAPVNASRVLI